MGQRRKIMAITYTGRMNIPNIVCLSSDVSGGKIEGAQPGMVAYFSDSKAWKIILSDLTLGDYQLPVGTIVSLLGASEEHVGQVGGLRAMVTGTVTRPADTTAYSIYDAISNSTSAPTILTFSSASRVANASGTIIDAIAACNNGACTARLELDLYRLTPTPINDNAEGTFLAGDIASYVGTITFNALAKPTTNSTEVRAFPNTSLRIPFSTNASANLFGILRTLDAFTPASATIHYIILKIMQD